MGWIHPVVFALVTLAGLYVTWLGWQRFCCLHLDKKRFFAWKKHVRWGTAVLVLWAVGPFAGLAGAHLVWGGTFIAPIHAYPGLAMLPFIIVGYLTGRTLDKIKKRRKLLPLAHGANNLILVLLSLWQAYTGYGLLQTL